jgi:hypothetical protein
MEAMNWLKPYTQAPSPKAIAPKFPQEFAAKLAAFKSAHGIRERFSMVCYCSRFGKPFEAIFERASENERFEVSSITKLTAGASAQSCGTPAVARTYAADLFGMSGWSCPYCRASGWVHCSCGTNTCSHQLNDAKDGMHRCEPGCGTISKAIPLKEMTASATSTAPAALSGRARPALPGAIRASLSGPVAPRLPLNVK